MLSAINGYIIQFNSTHSTNIINIYIFFARLKWEGLTDFRVASWKYMKFKYFAKKNTIKETSCKI